MAMHLTDEVSGSSTRLTGLSKHFEHSVRSILNGWTCPSGSIPQTVRSTSLERPVPSTSLNTVVAKRLKITTRQGPRS